MGARETDRGPPESFIPCKVYVVKKTLTATAFWDSKMKFPFQTTLNNHVSRPEEHVLLKNFFEKTLRFGCRRWFVLILLHTETYKAPYLKKEASYC